MDCVKCQTPLPIDGRYCPGCGTETGDRSGEHAASCPVAQPASSEALRRRLAEALEGRYRVTRLLGQGGMAAVFLAEDLTLDRPVAIKVLPPDMVHDEQLISRFQQEAKTAAKLDHPNIIPIYGVESEGSLHYFVMKYVAGRSLDDVLAEKNPLPFPMVRQVLRESALALGHAHRRGIVHRDVKPANIMLDGDGRVVLTDFGISKALQGASQLTTTGMIIGTPHYMAPEQAKGADLDGRADQYSLAVVAFAMLTGRLPFQGDSVHTLLYQQIFEEPPAIDELRSDTPPGLAGAIAKALSKRPEERFATLEEFAEAVSAPEAPATRLIRPMAGYTKTERRRSAPTRSTEPTGHPSSRRQRWLIGAGFVVVALAAVGARTMRPSRAELPRTAGPAIAAQPESVAVTRAGDSALVSAPPPDSAATASPIAPRRRELIARRLAARREAAARRGPVPRAAPQPQPTTLMAPAPSRVALLTVASEPWGTVYVDGVEIGPTPVADHALPPGTYQIRVEQEGYRAKRETIQVTGPNPIRRRYVLEPGGTP